MLAITINFEVTHPNVNLLIYPPSISVFNLVSNQRLSVTQLLSHKISLDVSNSGNLKVNILTTSSYDLLWAAIAQSG